MYSKYIKFSAISFLREEKEDPETLIQFKTKMGMY